MTKQTDVKGIVVLGMHRSGTSCLSGSLALCGAYPGSDEELTRPNAENRKGFFELKAMREFCDESLFAAECDWWNVADFSIDRITHEKKNQLLKLANTAFGKVKGHAPWVVKEPRLCFVLPILMRVIDTPVFVRILRNPVEVAMSLRFRNGFTISHGLALWEIYNRSILNVTAGHKLHHVLFSELQNDPLKTVSELLGELESQGLPSLVVPEKERLLEFVDSDLQHESVQEKGIENYLTSSQAKLWEMLSEGQPLRTTSKLLESSTMGPALIDLQNAQKQSIELADLRLQQKTRLEGQQEEKNGPLELLLPEIENLSRFQTSAFDQLREQSSEQTQALHSHFKVLNRHLEKFESMRKSILEDSAKLESTYKRIDQYESIIATKDSEIESLKVLLDRQKEEHRSQLSRLESHSSIDVEQLKIHRDQLDLEVQVLINILSQRRSEIDDFNRAKRTESDIGKMKARALELELKQVRRDHLRKIREVRIQLRDELRRDSWIANFKFARAVRKSSAQIRKSEMFDEQWYLNTYPDVVQSGIDAAEHYLLHGGFEERNPGPRFDSRGYLDQYPDVESAGMNPLLHFLIHGDNENRTVEQSKP